MMRIISGKFKKHRLSSPQDKNTRPTMDRVRESVFNILEHRLLKNGFSSLNCLDAFAGSGALGLEALSRGAKNCILLKKILLFFKRFALIIKKFYKKVLWMIVFNTIYTIFICQKDLILFF